MEIPICCLKAATQPAIKSLSYEPVYLYSKLPFASMKPGDGGLVSLNLV